MFCVSLWMLDAYWYYSLFTVFMLLVFEGTVVRQRLRNLDTLRSLAERPPRPVLAFRGKRWVQVRLQRIIIIVCR